MAEEERVDTGSHGCFCTMLYDDLQRRNWSSRAERMDPSLDLEAECMKPQKMILESARQRLGPVLKAAGVAGHGHSAPSAQHGRSAPLLSGSHEPDLRATLRGLMTPDGDQTPHQGECVG